MKCGPRAGRLHQLFHSRRKVAANMLQTLRNLLRATIPQPSARLARRVAPAIFILSGCCLLLAACARSGKTNSEAQVPLAPTTAILVDTQSLRPFPPNFFCLNQDLAPSACSWNNPRFLKAIKPFQPRALAYPGASAINCWDWAAGLARTEWINSLAKASTATLGLCDYANRVAAFSAFKGGVPMGQFLQACRQLNAAPLFRANLLNQKPENTTQWYHASAAFGMPALQWEMGAGLWRPEYRHAFPSASTYLEKARAHAEALRALAQGIKIAVGIPSDALALMALEQPSANRKKDSKAKESLSPESTAREQAVERERAFLKAWVTELASQQFYQATTMDLHYTMKADASISPETIFRAVCQQTPGRVNSLVELQAEWFREKTIWISDWGISISNRPEYQGSMLHALSLGEMALALAERAPRVEQIYYSTAANHLGLQNEPELQESMRESFSKKGKIVSSKNLPLRYGEPDAAALILRLLGNLFSQTESIAAVRAHQPPRLPDMRRADDTEDTPREDPPTAIHTSAFMSKDGILWLAAINRSPQLQPVRLVVNQKQMGGTIQMQSLWASSLLPASDDSATTATHPLHRPSIEKKMQEATRIELPPYSFSIIQSMLGTQ